MHAHLDREEAADRITSQLAVLQPERGVIYVDGPLRPT